MTCNWKLIKSTAATNLIENPSFEVNVTDFWALGGTGSRARDITKSYSGVASAKITAGAGSTYLQGSISLGDGETLYAQAQTWTTDAANARLIIYDSTNTTTRATTTATLTSQWELLEAEWENDTGGAVTAYVWLINNVNDSATEIWFDAIDAQIDTDTTYIDGDQPGCQWDGIAHNSTSSRDADAWQGGEVFDFQDDYHFDIVSVSGSDSPPVEVFGTDYAILAGETADGERIAARDLFLVGWVFGSTKAQMRARITALYDELKHWRSGQTTRNSDPVRIVYEGTYRSVALACKYVRGFDGRYDAAAGNRQRIAIMLRAQEDVWWEALNPTSVILDEEDSGTGRYVMSKVDGVWSLMGPPAAATSGASVNAILHDGINLYCGGDTVDFNADGDLDYFFKWSGSAWVTCGSGGEGTGEVSALARMPDGKIAIGGPFLNWDSDADMDFCILYDQTAATYAALDAGPSASVFSLAVSPIDGELYAALPLDVEYFSGGAWVSTSASGWVSIRSIAFDPNGILYAAGWNFVGVLSEPRFKSYDGSSWTSIADGSNAGEYLQACATLSDGRVVIGGDVTEIDGQTISNIAMYNGQTFDDMNGGLDDAVRYVFVSPDDEVYACTEGGDVKIYNGSVWYDVDADFGNIVYSIAFDEHDTYFSFAPVGTKYYSGDTTITTVGSSYFNPTIKIARSGGTSATLKYIQNVNGDQEMYFDLPILDGETITIDTVARTIKSDAGRRITGNPLPGSMLGTFTLNGGSNIINLWVDTAGSPTITAIMTYTARYDGVGGSEVA